MYPVLVLVHVLLLVFWVGTDVGVFVLFRAAAQPALTVPQRMICLEIAGRLDRFPRLCFVLILAVGATLAFLGQWLPLTAPMLAAIWVLDIVWLAVVSAGMALEGRPAAARVRWIERAFQVAIGAGVSFIAVRALADPAHPVAAWLAYKLLCYGGICLLAIVLDWIGPPVNAAFAELGRDGPSEALQARLDRGIRPVLGVVLLIYAVAILAAWFGLGKMPG